jgi:hypothetical protein
MKTILYILGGLFAVTVIAVIVVFLMLGSIVKSGVNTYGPKLTQTKVELKGATLSPFSGKGSLTGFTVGNPAGWKTEHAFFLNEISIDVVPKSVTTEHIVINSIVIDNPEIIYETTGTLTTSNIQDLIRNIQGQGTAQTAPTAEKEKAPQQQASPEKQTKIEIKSFRLTNVTIKVAYNTNVYTVKIPDLVMADLGTREGGLPPDQLAIAILKEIGAQAAQAAAKSAIKSGLKDRALEGLQNLLGK